MPQAVRHRPSLALISAVALVAVALVGVLPAAAQPSSQELRGQRDTVQQRLDELMMEVAEVVEDYNEATVALDAAEAELAATEAEHADLTAQVTRLGSLAEDHVRRIHKLGPGLELSSIFVAGNPTDAGAKAATLRRVLEGQRADLEGLGAARVAVAATEQRLEEQRTLASTRAEEVAQRRERLDALVASQQDEIATLERQITTAEAREEEERRRAEEERLRREAEERAQQEAEERARQQAREREAARAREREQARQRPAAAPPATAPTTSSGGDQPAPSTRRSAQTAIDTAMAQVGKPYRYGGSGPDSFDCSGLTSFAWRAAGVEITRTSRSQYAATQRISRGDLQPGDLVFYGRSTGRISHVAMYIGGSSVVEAPYTGANVRVRGDGLSRRDIVGYGRV